MAAACGGTFWLVCTLTATLGFGYHYGVDLVAGAVLCLTIESALRDPERGWGWFRVRLVGGGALVLAGLLFSYRYLAVPMADYPGVRTARPRCPRRDEPRVLRDVLRPARHRTRAVGQRREGSGH